MSAPTACPDCPDFRSNAFLAEHAQQTMAFYDRRAIDPSGGFFHFFRDDGTVYDTETRHLVSSARFVVTHAWAARRFPEHPRSDAWKAAARHGLRFLEEVHRDNGHGGYAWLLRWKDGRAEVLDETQHCYGLAFVLLAYAEAARAGIDAAAARIGETFMLMETHFWEPAQNLYADEAVVMAAGGPWRVSPYRGQNANMHACEAMLAAHDATGDSRYLDRASVVADAVTVRLAAHAGGLVWEHYRSADGLSWQPDWQFHRDDRSDIFRPWGFQTGHLAEWSKLLLALERKLPIDAAQTLVPRARALFAAAVDHGWDRRDNGLAYGFAGADDPAGASGKYAVCDAERYFWVQAEAIAAAAALAARTNEGGYWDWYDRLWTYAWTYFVDHEHGAWYRVLSADNRKLGDEKSPAGKVDYHTVGACYESMDALNRLG